MVVVARAVDTQALGAGDAAQRVMSQRGRGEAPECPTQSI